MKITSTYFFKRFVYPFIRQQLLLLLLMMVCPLVFSQAKTTGSNDSLQNKRPVLITVLEQCGIPVEMTYRIKHYSPSQIKEMNEEYQFTSLSDEGDEMMTTVKMRFTDNHIVGYIKQAPVQNSGASQNINYIDIPVEWMCIPPKRDHPYHFCANIAQLDDVKAANGCMDWVQRDNYVVVNYANEMPQKKKWKLFANRH